MFPDPVNIVVRARPVVKIAAGTLPGIRIVAAGNIGPPGPSGKWTALTQSEYDLLDPPDPDTLYIIIQ